MQNPFKTCTNQVSCEHVQCHKQVHAKESYKSLMLWIPRSLLFW